MGFTVYAYYHSFALFYGGVTSGGFFTPALFTFVLGLFLLLVTLLGFFGSLKESTCLVNLYALVLTILLIMKFVVVILAFTLDTAAIKEFLHIPIEKYVTDLEIEMEIDRMQRSLNCCGNESFFDYVGMNFTSHNSVTVFPTPNGVVTVPASCCITEGQEYCFNIKTMGCQSALMSLFTRNSSAIGILGITVTIMKVLGIVFALLLARCIRRAKSERGLIAWTNTEREIAARQQQAQPTQDITNDSGSSNA
ncbi:CD63 antigen [Bicyclus anynana]|uniref:Tetraspanin n=1 Tax=Bicyclus anynana TaxID=110368 RepID=A0ABM3LEM3_BICAN|nr:CD63 antigen [Bicyclus anynana]